MRTVILRKFTAYMRPCPDCPVLYPNIYLRKPPGIFQHFPTFFQRFQRIERIERIGANAKTQLLGENATFGRKYNLLRKTADLQH